MQSNQRGFTLVEILIVISLLGFLSVLGFNAYTGVRKSARDSKRKADMEMIRSSLEMYRSTTGFYPDDITQLIKDKYLTEIPTDPLNKAYVYTPECEEDICRDYVLKIELEQDKTEYKVGSTGVVKGADDFIGDF